MSCHISVNEHACVNIFILEFACEPSKCACAESSSFLFVIFSNFNFILCISNFVCMNGATQKCYIHDFLHSSIRLSAKT